LKNEYPDLGGNYEVIHHTTFLQQLINSGKIKMRKAVPSREKDHVSRFMLPGRANEIYEAPRQVLESLDADLVEMKRCRTTGLCLRRRGRSNVKEPEKGNKDINVSRTEKR